MIGAIKKNAVSWLTGGFIDGKSENGPDGNYTFHFMLKPNKVVSTEGEEVYGYSLSVDLSDDLIEEAGDDNTKLFDWGIDFVVEKFREAIKDSYKETS